MQRWLRRAELDAAHFTHLDSTRCKIRLVSKVYFSGQPGGGLPIQWHRIVTAAWVHVVASVTSLVLQLPLQETLDFCDY